MSKRLRKDIKAGPFVAAYTGLKLGYKGETYILKKDDPIPADCEMNARQMIRYRHIVPADPKKTPPKMSFEAEQRMERREAAKRIEKRAIEAKKKEAKPKAAANKAPVKKAAPAKKEKKPAAKKKAAPAKAKPKKK